MKKVITMVGTSLLEKYQATSGDRTFQKYINDLKDRKSSDYDKESLRVLYIKTNITKWLESQKPEKRLKASAELSSLDKLKEKFGKHLSIFLLCSDTILSRICGEILSKKLDFDDIVCETIPSLRVQNKSEFKEGLETLVEKIQSISGGYWENIIINITGGYKAVIPYLTMLAQIYRCPIFYIFEDTEELIEISPTPINIDWGLFEKFSHVLEEMEKGIYDLEKFRKEYPEYDRFYSELKSLIWTDNNLAELNPLGKIFWRKYKDYLLLEIPQKSDYFRLTKSEKQRLHNAVLELYERLKKFLAGVSDPKEAIQMIVSLKDTDDLRHGPLIDKEKGVFVFKSTNETHIRFSYTFRLDKNGEIVCIRLFNFVLESFDHNKYLQEFKEKYKELSKESFKEIPISKRSGE